MPLHGDNHTVTASPALRFYAHVPYCSSRCGYCDFNTYVPGEPGRGSQAQWRRAAVAEVRHARAQLGDDDRPISSVFFGGGTPTLLPVSDLASVIAAISQEFGIRQDAEVTVEANPENVTPGLLDDLLAAGVTRLSIGMQSADARVLSVLDRRHRPGGAIRAARLAELAGFQRVSLDLIYGTPGESVQSWRDTVATAIGTGVTHVSAYALKVESGTVLDRRVRHGKVPAPDDDFAAECYEIADSHFGRSGLHWYEISNWSAPGHECRHNLGYWRGDDWWGLGPGAHSHLAGTRFWNLRHPQRWIEALDSGSDPRDGSETLTADQQRTEATMLAVRLADGFDPADLVGSGSEALMGDLRGRGLVESIGHRWRLTRRGRLLADAVTLQLLDARAA